MNCFNSHIRVALSLFLLASLLGSVAIKSFHHADHHDNAEICNAEDSNHFHSEFEAEHCAICEFYFSPYNERDYYITGAKCNHISDCNKNSGDSSVAQHPSYNYALRAPPATV